MGPRKASSNVRKHGVRFAEAVSVFHDDLAITIRDEDSDPSEERFVTLGMGLRAQVLVVAYCHRGGNIWIISARRAGPSECERYEAQR